MPLLHQVMYAATLSYMQAGRCCLDDVASLKEANQILKNMRITWALPIPPLENLHAYIIIIYMQNWAMPIIFPWKKACNYLGTNT